MSSRVRGKDEKVNRVKIGSCYLLSLLFLAAGIMHFVKPAFYMKIMPPYIPFPSEMVLLSGGFEVIGGVALLVPRLRRAAGYGLILLLVAVFPANIHMAIHNELFPSIPSVVLWLRLPLQPLLMAWVWSAAIKRKVL